MKEAHDTDVGDLFKVKLAKKAYHLGKKGMLYFHYLPKLLLNFSAFLRKKMALPPFISANFFEKGFSGVILERLGFLFAPCFPLLAPFPGWEILGLFFWGGDPKMSWENPLVVGEPVFNQHPL